MSINTPDLGLEIPPLREGDRLTADEFHRRYEAMPELKNANLVNGVVHMSSPVREDHHGAPMGLILLWLGHYSYRLPGVHIRPNTTLRVDDDNEPQPDAMMVLAPEHGGSSWVDDQDYRRGAPELIVEISASTLRLDTGGKRDLYQRIGAQEYIVWRVTDDLIDWWELVDGTYQRLLPNDAGVIRSRIFPGLWLDVPALIARDRNQLADVLEAGLASPEHKEFARRLNPGG